MLNLRFHIKTNKIITEFRKEIKIGNYVCYIYAYNFKNKKIVLGLSVNNYNYLISKHKIKLLNLIINDSDIPTINESFKDVDFNKISEIYLKPFKGSRLDKLLYRNGNKCYHCGVETVKTTENIPTMATVDHLIPKSLDLREGIKHSIINTVVSCKHCNNMKSNKSINIDLDHEYQIRLDKLKNKYS